MYRTSGKVYIVEDVIGLKFWKGLRIFSVPETIEYLIAINLQEILFAKLFQTYKQTVKTQ